MNDLYIVTNEHGHPMGQINDCIVWVFYNRDSAERMINRCPAGEKWKIETLKAVKWEDAK